MHRQGADVAMGGRDIRLQNADIRLQRNDIGLQGSNLPHLSGVRFLSPPYLGVATRVRPELPGLLLLCPADFSQFTGMRVLRLADPGELAPGVREARAERLMLARASPGRQLVHAQLQ